MRFRKSLSAGLLLALMTGTAVAQTRSQNAVSPNVLLAIIRAEDQRQWGADLSRLLDDKDPKVRKRAALAAGRIGNEHAVPALANLLKSDSDPDVRQMAAFAIGEIESSSGGDALIAALGNGPNREAEQVSGAARARSIEALGKIAAALNDTEKERKRLYGEVILKTLDLEAARRSAADQLTIVLGLTAAVRAKPEGAGAVIVRFLDHSDPRVVAAALNTMARLRLKDNNEQVAGLLTHRDPIVRANAARVAGAAEDQKAFAALLARAQSDSDLRVRVSAIRALGALRDTRATPLLLDRGSALLTAIEGPKGMARPNDVNEVLEIATALGLILRNSKSESATGWLRRARPLVKGTAPEIEMAYARIAPMEFASGLGRRPLTSKGDTPLTIAKRESSTAQGIAEVAVAKSGDANVDRSINEASLAATREALCRPELARASRGNTFSSAACVPLQNLSLSDYLRAYAALKPDDLDEVLRARLHEKDVVVRGTAADLLGDRTPSEANERALIAALQTALKDRDLNDAALSILDSLAKQKTASANEAMKAAFASPDELVRRRAVNLLKANGAGDFSDRLGSVKTRNTNADYRRAIARMGRPVRARIVTTKGAFTIEFLPEDAPLTVDNFVMLARRGYFNGQTVPRVVPNFVIQTGDPRGDQNGGPGYQIRCEINEVPYERGAVGMALSGKDTGGSQWFVTHSPQLHLDGGYTVFGRVISGMETVDNIARGDTIKSVLITER